MRAWKLFGLLPSMLLQRTRHHGRLGRSELEARADLFAAGDWAALLADQHEPSQRRQIGAFDGQADTERRGQAVQAKVRLNEISQARQCLTGAPLAPRNEATLQELRSKRPHQVMREVPADIRNHIPSSQIELDRDIFLDCLRSAPRGSSPGPGGMTYEVLKLCLDDESCTDLLSDADSCSRPSTYRSGGCLHAGSSDGSGEACGRSQRYCNWYNFQAPGCEDARATVLRRD